ncbi:MAG TPA: hypothetical protein VFQ54_05125 [Thermomicrobiales bacterium]|nr:hypothetical protein [Thermomicrobiales bacterium]
MLKQTGYELDFPFWDDDETQPIIGFTTFARDLMSPDDIQTATIQYTPEDSKEIETYPHPNGLDTVARYNSASLVKMMATFDSAGLNWFPNGDPGDFVLILHPADADPSRIDTVDVGLGNNP